MILILALNMFTSPDHVRLPVTESMMGLALQRYLGKQLSLCINPFTDPSRKTDFETVIYLKQHVSGQTQNQIRHYPS